jgi:Uma2 family endonuclease
MQVVPQVSLGRPANYQDVANAPEHVVAEIVNGEFWTSPRPAPRHANATSVLGVDVGGPYHQGRGGPGGWWILDEPELHLGDDVLVPDLAGWRRERMPVLPDTAYFPLPPDWVCEVLSPATAVLDRARKLPIYARHGVAHAWLVDPIARTLEVLALRDGLWTIVTTYGSSGEIRAEPFGAAPIDLLALWGDPAPPAAGS